MNPRVKAYITVIFICLIALLGCFIASFFKLPINFELFTFVFVWVVAIDFYTDKYSKDK